MSVDDHPDGFQVAEFPRPLGMSHQDDGHRHEQSHWDPHEPSVYPNEVQWVHKLQVPTTSEVDEE